MRKEYTVNDFGFTHTDVVEALSDKPDNKVPEQCVALRQLFAKAVCKNILGFNSVESAQKFVYDRE